jgi:hypothetical protein
MRTNRYIYLERAEPTELDIFEQLAHSRVKSSSLFPPSCPRLRVILDKYRSSCSLVTELHDLLELMESVLEREMLVLFVIPASLERYTKDQWSSLDITSILSGDEQSTFIVSDTDVHNCPISRYA